MKDQSDAWFAAADLLKLWLEWYEGGHNNDFHMYIKVKELLREARKQGFTT